MGRGAWPSESSSAPAGSSEASGAEAEIPVTNTNIRQAYIRRGVRDQRKKYRAAHQRVKQNEVELSPERNYVISSDGGLARIAGLAGNGGVQTPISLKIMGSYMFAIPVYRQLHTEKE